MEIVDIIIKISSLIGAVGVIIASMGKLLDVKLKPLTNQNRMQFRHEIVSFANSLQLGEKKSIDEFGSIYELVDEYQKICKNLNLKNHLFEESLKIIDEAYQNLK